MDEGMDFDLLAAALRSDSTDERTFLEVLSRKLLDALPGATVVEREGGLLHRDHRVARLAVTLGSVAFEVRRRGERVEAERRQMVRGIALKSEQVSLGKWIEELSAALVEHARSSAEARQALERFLLP